MTTKVPVSFSLIFLYQLIQASAFYQRSSEDITRILSVSYGMGVPAALLGPYVVATYGLSTGLYTGECPIELFSLSVCPQQISIAP